MFAIAQEPNLNFHRCKLSHMTSNLQILRICKRAKIDVYTVCIMYICSFVHSIVFLQWKLPNLAPCEPVFA